MYGGHAYAIGLGNLSHALAFNDTGINAKPLRFGQSVQRVPQIAETLHALQQLLRGRLGKASGAFDPIVTVEGIAPIPELTDTKNSRNMERKGAAKMETKKKKGTPPPRYDEAFKAGAVRMVTEQGRQPTEVAKDLGICIDTLRSWLKATGIQMGQASRQNREQQRIRELEAENRALRKQLGEKDEVIDILKKSVGILSKP